MCDYFKCFVYFLQISASIRLRRTSSLSMFCKAIPAIFKDLESLGVDLFEDNARNLNSTDIINNVDEDQVSFQ